MTLVWYTGSNNSQSTFAAGINASAPTLIVKTWEWALFPSTFPFLLALEEYNANDVVTKREIVKCTWRSTDTLTIVRSQWTCVQDDTADPKVQWTIAYSFSTDDFVSLYLTNEQMEDIQAELVRLEADKLDADWELRTWNGAWKTNYNDWSWDENELALWAVDRVLTSWWTAAAPTWEVPTVDINWLVEDNSLDADDMLVFYDNTEWANNKRQAKWTTTVPWLLPLATETETVTWTETEKAVTPAWVAQALVWWDYDEEYLIQWYSDPTTNAPIWQTDFEWPATLDNNPQGSPFLLLRFGSWDRIFSNLIGAVWTNNPSLYWDDIDVIEFEIKIKLVWKSASEYFMFWFSSGAAVIADWTDPTDLTEKAFIVHEASDGNVYLNTSDWSTASDGSTASATYTNWITYKLVLDVWTNCKLYVNGILWDTKTTNLPSSGAKCNFGMWHSENANHDYVFWPIKIRVKYA